ncbi:hypothetical protein ANAEL_01185 [Anaerolineales bacterium]|nr:hypothetical protein ANAEL_01185 [Anaerolineales bacterium]
MPKRTNPFQELTAAIMASFHESEYSVEESVLEQNPRTGVVREIDIRVIRCDDPKDRTLIECRAHKRPQDVQWIDALEGKSRSLGFSKTIAVSSSGFTKSAVIEARDRGIEVLHLRQAEEVDWRKWMFAIDKLGINIEGPIFTGVSLGIDAEWPGIIPGPTNLSEIVLVDKRDGTRIPLLTWVNGLLTDPQQLEELRSLKKASPIVKLEKKHPCAPEMGFVLKGVEEFIPLAELTVHIDYISSIYDIPLEHMKMGGERFLVGGMPILGVPTRVVIHDNSNDSTIMLEQRRIPNKNKKI